MINRVARILRHPRVVYRELSADEGGVLLHLESGQYHGLNRTGALIWNLLDGERTVDEILTAVSGLLRDAPDDLRADLATFLAGLHERNLVQILNGNTAPTS